MKCQILMFMMFFSAGPVGAQSKAEALRIVSSQSSLYEVLGVTSDATPAEVKAAYRRLLSVYHPDRHQGNSANLKAANQVMTRLNSARETLLDPLKRKAYDVTVKATSVLRPKASNSGAAAAKTAEAWKKAPFTDFTAKSETPKSARTEKPSKAPEAGVKQTASSALKEPFTGTAGPSEKPPASSSRDIRGLDKPGTSTTGKRAQKIYGETSRCGLRYFEVFVDEMI